MCEKCATDTYTVCMYIPATVGVVEVIVVAVAVTIAVMAMAIVVAIVVGFNSPVLHSVVLNISLGGLTALFVTDDIRTLIIVLVTSGNGILLAEVFPTTVTSMLPSSG